MSRTYQPCTRVQEVAGNHGVALWGRTEEGFATDPIMVANNLIFVATRIQIRMDSYPKWCVSPWHPPTTIHSVVGMSGSYRQAR